MHAERAQYGTCLDEVFYIVRAYFARKQFGVNLHICMNIEEIPWHVIVRMPGH